MNCLFCKIIAGEIPAEIVYQDEDVIAFLDIKPNNPGHTLIVPRKHSDGLEDADSQTLDAVMHVTQRVARALVKGLHAPAFNIIQNNGAEAGQAVPHLHFHVIPRREGDGFKHWQGTPYASDREAHEVAEMIKGVMG